MPAPVIFDIETGPLDRAIVLAQMPPAEPPSEFDPASVKVGGIKNQSLIEEKIKAAREKHAQMVATLATKRQEDEDTFVARAALSPLTGRVLAIGYRQRNTTRAETGIEPVLLSEFWQFTQHWRETKTQLIGFNILNFDLPFLIRRSWANGIAVPLCIWKGNRLSSELFVDLADLWNAGCWPREYIKLDRLCQFFGLPGKNGDGAMFAEMLEKNRGAAEAYLLNDLEITLTCAKRMGVAA